MLKKTIWATIMTVTVALVATLFVRLSQITATFATPVHPNWFGSAAVVLGFLSVFGYVMWRWLGSLERVRIPATAAWVRSKPAFER